MVRIGGAGKVSQLERRSGDLSNACLNLKEGADVNERRLSVEESIAAKLSFQHVATSFYEEAVVVVSEACSFHQEQSLSCSVSHPPHCLQYHLSTSDSSNPDLLLLRYRCLSLLGPYPSACLTRLP